MKETLEQTKVEILGHKIEVGKLQNPRLRQVICRRTNCFSAGYGDTIYTDHTEEYRDYHDWDDSDFKCAFPGF